MDIYGDVTQIKGIGAVKKKLFHKIGVCTIEDLLYQYPRNYKDKSKLTQIENLVVGEYTTIKGRIVGKPIEQRIRNSMVITKVTIADETGSITGVWFNNRFIKNTLKFQCEYYFYGRIGSGHTKTIEVPEFEMVGEGQSKLLRIVPEYALTEGLTQKDIRNAISNVLMSMEGCFTDGYDPLFRDQFQLAEVNFALWNIHFPKDFTTLDLAKRRFKFEELLTVQYGLAQLKEHSEKSQGIILEDIQSIEFIEELPFALTPGQKNSIEDIKKDFSSGYAMNRLLQGDVGSGKTIVAILALLICVQNGYQGAFLVPTEILAEQHMISLREVLGERKIGIEILKGGMTAKKKTEVLEALEQGLIQILVGTHAVLQESVKFKKLGLVITDEQHRFGVKQRAIMLTKGQAPHMLVMTATPIPRTLSLILYGDLDISVIQDKPENRKPIETYTIDSRKKERLYGFIKKHLNEGRQGYIICPLVEKSEKLDLLSATEYYEELKNTHFINYRLALLHGKMKASEKDDIMECFRHGKIDLLISTTVVEVGVNVPNATIMVIENAERFGLSQLHQLRGRVGRGSAQSYCILVSDIQNQVSKERLKIMVDSEDGFVIAEKDLKLRGGGELLGTRQHGTIQFKLADIFNDIDLLRESREAAKYLIENRNHVDTKQYMMKKLNTMMDGIILN